MKRFNAELLALGATRIRVELVKTKTEKGKALHRLQLKGVVGKQTIDAVLSEGERRIVALAAFLADLTEKPSNAPFIFDDPISSLDQTWEERTIERLVQLSETRQVIVFTHRLSFMGLIDEKAEKLDAIHIRQEHWGAGEIGEVPLYGKKPEAALNDLRNTRLSKARNVYEIDGSEAYYPEGKAICSDFRVLLERVVEFVLLADVVQRHRRAVNTQGKIQKLAKISSADCALIEELMSKYSRYEHSQSNEAAPPFGCLCSPTGWRSSAPAICPTARHPSRFEPASPTAATRCWPSTRRTSCPTAAWAQEYPVRWMLGPKLTWWMSQTSTNFGRWCGGRRLLPKSPGKLTTRFCVTRSGRNAVLILKSLFYLFCAGACSQCQLEKMGQFCE